MSEHIFTRTAMFVIFTFRNLEARTLEK